MRGEGAGRPGLNCCASYWPISLLKAEAFGRSKSRSPVAALPLCRRLTCAARARAICAPRKWVRRKVESFMTPCPRVHARRFFLYLLFSLQLSECSAIHSATAFSVAKPLITSVSPSGQRTSTTQPNPGFFRATKVGRCSYIFRICACGGRGSSRAALSTASRG